MTILPERDDPAARTATDGGDIAAGRRALRTEAEALAALAAALDASFAEATARLAAVAGRVVVTGMGKSGHVARKIAATLASTGTPALFVHPGEASHGDLGMIARDDGVIALSNSGAVPELADIIAYTRRFSIPLIAITARRESPLAEAADVALILPKVPEACPMGLAPTTSTTLMMALGDALAIALLERRGFTSDDFRVLHPGGHLGRRLTRVADIMHGPGELPLVPAETPMAEAILAMTAKSFGCVGIVGADGRLTGIITDGDLRRHMTDGLLALSAGAVMTARPKTIRPQALAAEALAEMNERKITSLFVVDGDRPVGLVHVHDLLRAGVA
ncbi:MAG: KpsF/GutQ protein [Alphaproteobacteria bacterium]|nr:MAG: KpsF/GutQ protein [Alphaproteobacteria bacterium]